MRSSLLCSDVRNRANLFLQILLWLNVYQFGAWSIIYGFHILYDVSRFFDTQGIFVILAYLIANICEFLRLNAGYSGNLKAQPADLNRFLIMTPLILLPILLFLLISVKGLSTLISILTYLLFALMSLEFPVGILAWQKLCSYQTEIYKLKREITLQQKLRSGLEKND